jgi:hypothetical protein
MLVFLLFALTWAIFSFLNLFTADEGFCEASIGTSSFSDQIARTVMVGLLIWSFGNIESAIEQTTWRVVVAIRLLVATAYVGFTRAEVKTTCEARPQNLGLPIALLVLDFAILVVLTTRIALSGIWSAWRQSQKSGSSSEIFKYCTLSVLFLAWDALSAPMILRRPSGNLVLKLIPPSVGLLLVIAFVCFYPSSLLHFDIPIPDVEQRKPPMLDIPRPQRPLSPRLGSPYTLPVRRELPLRVVNPSKASSSRSSVRWDMQSASYVGVWTGTETIFSPDPPLPPAKENRASFRSRSSVMTPTSANLEPRSIFENATMTGVPRRTFEGVSPLSRQGRNDGLEKVNSQRFEAVRSTLSTIFPPVVPEASEKSDLPPLPKLLTSETAQRRSRMSQYLTPTPIDRKNIPSLPPQAALIARMTEAKTTINAPVFMTSTTLVESNNDADEVTGIDDAFLNLFQGASADATSCTITSVETLNVQVGNKRLSIQRNSQLFSPNAPRMADIPENPVTPSSASHPERKSSLAGLGVAIVDIGVAVELDPEERKSLTPAPLAPLKRATSEASTKTQDSVQTVDRRLSRKPVPRVQPQQTISEPTTVESSIDENILRARASEEDTPVLRESLLLDETNEASRHRESIESQPMVAHATSVKRIDKTASVVNLRVQQNKPKRTKSILRSNRRSVQEPSPPPVPVLPPHALVSDSEPLESSADEVVASHKPSWHYRVGDKIPSFSRRVRRQETAPSPKPPPIPLRSSRRERATLQKRNGRSPRSMIRDVQKSLAKYQEPKVSPPMETSDKLFLIDDSWAGFIEEEKEKGAAIDVISRQSSAALPAELPVPKPVSSERRPAAARIAAVATTTDRPFSYLKLQLDTPRDITEKTRANESDEEREIRLILG